MIDRPSWIDGAAAMLFALLVFGFVAIAGGFLLFGGRYSSCVSGRPSGITMEGLAGTYSSTDGGRLVLDASGTLEAEALVSDVDSRWTLSGAGSWLLLPPDDDT